MSTVNNSDLLVVERDGNLYQIAYDQMSTLNDDDLFCVERDGVSYKVEAQYVGAASGAIVSQPTLSATNSSYAPTTFTATSPTISNATFYSRQWYKDDVIIPGATDLTYYATEIGTYKYEETWADEAGNVLTPSVSQDALLLALAAPTINSPAFGSGIPDFNFTAESSAITNTSSLTTLDDFTSITSRTGQYEYIESDVNGSVFVTADVSSSDYFEISTDGGATWSNSNTVTSTPWLSLRGHCFVDSSSYKGFIFSSYGPTGSGGDTPTFKSAQGNYLSWSQAGTIPSYSSSQGRYDQIATDNDGFIVACGSSSNVAYSTDNADSWTRVSPGSGGTADSFPHWSAATYFAKLGKFVISTSSQSSSGNNIYLSGDKSQVQSGSWTIHDSASNPSPGISDMACNDDYLFALCGSYSGSALWRTSDLTSWTKIADFEATNSDMCPYYIKVKGSTVILIDFLYRGPNTGDIIVSTDNGSNWIYKKINASGDTFGSLDAAIDKDNNIVAVNDRKSPRVARTKLNVTATLTLTDTTVSKTSDGSLVGGTTINHVLTVGETVQSDTTVSGSYASGTVSESAGNVITLTDVSGTWSDGMKIRGATTDTMDYPDPIDTSTTFTSSEPVVTTGVVNSWTNANAEWQLAHDLLFAGAVQTKGLPITETGEQTGPDDFVLDGSTDYYVRVKYGTSDPEDTTAEWSTTTHFRTAPKSAVITSVPTSVNEGSSATVQVTTTNVVTGGYIYWEVTNSDDFTTSSGQAYVSSNSSTFYVYPTADNTAEGTESFQVKIYSDSARTDLLDTSDSITINDTSDGSGQYMVGNLSSSSAQSAQWTCPSYVTSICVLCIGGGGGGDNGLGNYAGGGGGLAWRNNISVTPGQSYWITVGHGGNGGHSGYTGSNGQDGGDSYMHAFSNILIARGGGGGGTSNGVGGGYTGQGGGTGGNGGNGSQGNGAGGGGAAGYSGNGGNGGGGSAQSGGSSGSGGGAGGGGVSGRLHYYGEDPTNENTLFSAAGSGGGTGVYGQGSNGAGGYGLGVTAVGKGGSGGQDGMTGSNFVSPFQAGSFGGGGAQGHKIVATGSYTENYDDFGRAGALGSAGTVRIIWGPGRSFPSTNTQDV